MKACPTCHRKYSDETMKFCLDDGALLIEQMDPRPAGSPADATLHLPGSFSAQPPTVRMTEPPGGPRSTMASMGPPGGPALAVSPQTYPGETGRRGALLWVLGALIIGVAAVAVALIVTRNREPGGDSSSQMASASPVSTTTEPAVAATPATNNPTATPVQAQSRIATPSPSSEKKTSTVQSEAARPNKDAPPPTPPPMEKPASRGPISAGVLNGKAVNLVKPAYPPIARSANASGTVTVQVTIDESGNVISAHAVSGHPLLQSAAVSAARASKFSPTMLSGQPVKVTGVIVYNFVAQ